MTKRDPYEELGISSGAGPGEIREAFRRAVRQRHPDTSSSTDGAGVRDAIEAYRLLIDPVSRARYDSAASGEPGGRRIPVRRGGRMTGAPPLGTTRRCSGCLGAGRVASTTTCPECGGLGEITSLAGRRAARLRCRTCGGRGAVRVWTQCRVCHGSGSVGFGSR